MQTTNQKLLATLGLMAALAFFAWVAYTLWLRGNAFIQASQGGAAVTVDQPQAVTARANYNVNTIVSAHIFGVKQVERKVVEQPKVVPKTNLRLRLVGLLASDEEGGIDRALIALESGPAKSYAVGDAIDRTDSTLHAVEPGRVLLDRNGRIETLELNRQRLTNDNLGASLNQPIDGRQARNRQLNTVRGERSAQQRQSSFRPAGSAQPIANLPARVRPISAQ